MRSLSFADLKSAVPASAVAAAAAAPGGTGVAAGSSPPFPHLPPPPNNNNPSTSPPDVSTAPWAPAPASAAGCSSAALPRFPLPRFPVACGSSTSHLLGVPCGQSQLLHRLPWSLLAHEVGSFLEVGDWFKLLRVSSAIRCRIFEHLTGQQCPGFCTLRETLQKAAEPNRLRLWRDSNCETVSENLSPSRFQQMDLSLGFHPDSTDAQSAGACQEEQQQRAPRPPVHLGVSRLVLGAWFNRLSAQDEEVLWDFLSKCNLEYVTVQPEFYHCACACCIKVRDEEAVPPKARRPVRVAAASPPAHQMITPRPPGSPGRTPYRRTHSGRWGPRSGRVSNGTRPASARQPLGLHRSSSSPGTSLRVFSGQRSRLTNRHEGFQYPEEEEEDDAPENDSDNSSSHAEEDERRAAESAASPRAESAPMRDDDGQQQRRLPRLNSTPSIGSVANSAEGEAAPPAAAAAAAACNETAQRHAVARVFWLFRLLIAHRFTIKYFDFNSPPAVCRTCGTSAGSLPDFPVPMRMLQGRIVFNELERLRFGPAVDCRYVVPFIDFCTFGKLWHLEILGLPLTYTESQPQFGKEPTLVFGPQFIFASGDSVPLWLPAVYNGKIDGQLQLQGRGVYASREYRYEGYFRDGRNQGQGLMVSTCGETYRGEWHDGRRHGQGVVTQADGRRLQGKWCKDSLHGRGHMHVSGGLNYDGEWKHGVLDGWGVMSNKEGELLAFGQFRNGRSHGWVVHKHDGATSAKAQSPTLTEAAAGGTGCEEDEDGEAHDWEVASMAEGDSPLRFPVETASVTAGSLCVPPPEFHELLQQQGRERLVYRIHRTPGWRGVWKRNIGGAEEDEALATAIDEQVLLLSAKNCMQAPTTAAAALTEIEEAGEPPANIPLWMDDVLAKLRIDGLC